VAFTLSDGERESTSVALVSIRNIADGPSITLAGSASLAYDEGSGALPVLDRPPIIADSDSDSLARAVVLLTGTRDDERIALPVPVGSGLGDGVTITNVTPLEIHIEGQRPLDAYAQLLAGVVYENRNTDTPAPGPRVVLVTVFDPTGVASRTQVCSARYGLGKRGNNDDRGVLWFLFASLEVIFCGTPSGHQQLISAPSPSPPSPPSLLGAPHRY